jgi:hypothetical protein
MQIRLAQSDVDEYTKQVGEKLADVERAKNNVGMAETRLTELQSEEAELERLIAGAKADSARKEGR